MSGRIPISASDLVARINEKIRQISRVPFSEVPTGDRTDLIKRCLKEIAPHYGLRSQATLPNKADREDLCHEFLLDVVWWAENELNRPERIALAVESERNPNQEERVRDFRKLLVFKSPLKLMIVVENRDDNETNEFVKRIDGEMETWKQHDRGEQYLLYVFASPRNRVFVAEVRGDGRPTLFRELDFMAPAVSPQLSAVS